METIVPPSTLQMNKKELRTSCGPHPWLEGGNPLETCRLRGVREPELGSDFPAIEPVRDRPLDRLRDNGRKQPLRHRNAAVDVAVLKRLHHPVHGVDVHLLALEDLLDTLPQALVLVSHKTNSFTNTPLEIMRHPKVSDRHTVAVI